MPTDAMGRDRTCRPTKSGQKNTINLQESNKLKFMDRGMLRKFLQFKTQCKTLGRIDEDSSSHCGDSREDNTHPIEPNLTCSDSYIGKLNSYESAETLRWGNSFYLILTFWYKKFNFKIITISVHMINKKNVLIVT